MFGLCEEGGQIVYDAVGGGPDTLIEAHGVRAGGLAKQGRSNKAIGHLDFAAAEAALPDAFAVSGMEMPEDF